MLLIDVGMAGVNEVLHGPRADINLTGMTGMPQAQTPQNAMVQDSAKIFQGHKDSLGIFTLNDNAQHYRYQISFLGSRGLFGSPCCFCPEKLCNLPKGSYLLWSWQKGKGKDSVVYYKIKHMRFCSFWPFFFLSGSVECQDTSSTGTKSIPVRKPFNHYLTLTASDLSDEEDEHWDNSWDNSVSPTGKYTTVQSI